MYDTGSIMCIYYLDLAIVPYILLKYPFNSCLVVYCLATSNLTTHLVNMTEILGYYKCCGVLNIAVVFFLSMHILKVNIHMC